MTKLGTYETSVEIDAKTITFAAGKLAGQADGSVVAGIGDTRVLSTTTAGPVKDFLGFFPLTIEVEERMYAAGRIPGSFFKREGRPSQNAILTCRLIDRPLRPTFVDGLRNEIQVINTVLQTTQQDPYDVVAMNGSSLATMLAGVPFHGPVAALRYALMRDGRWVAFPSFEELQTDAVFNMVVAGRVEAPGEGDEGDDEVAILMIEAEATPDAVVKVAMGADAPTEAVIGRAIEDVKPIIRRLCAVQRDFAAEVGVRDAVELPTFPEYEPAVLQLVRDGAVERVRDVYSQAELHKQAKNDALDAIRADVVARVVADGPDHLDDEERAKQAKNAFRSVEKEVVRRRITVDGVRIDGRGSRDIRPLSAEVGVLSKTHGSGLFQRGDTQVLSVLALGSTRQSQRIDTLDPEEERYYLHHYNFPPFSTGETGRVGSPKRREIGHGALAERALIPVLPSLDEWPYTMRVVSDVLSSNGSTSMASVCGSTLALMDGGVPILAPVAGIAMGLIHDGGSYTTLTDIQGTEDFFGDMDFKVAGTRDFVTALQLDTKLAGIPADVLAGALVQARDARLSILDVMQDAIAAPRDEVAEGAPRVEVVYIPQDKIGDVIGPRGKIIKEITDETGADIDIEEEAGRGVVRIYADSRVVGQAALDRINAIANPVLPEKGERYNATVVKTVDFGAFVSLTPGTDGLLHISEMSKMAGRRLAHADEVVDVGDKVLVEVLDVLDGGRKFKLAYVGDRPEPGGRADEAVDRPRSGAADVDVADTGVSGTSEGDDAGHRDAGGRDDRRGRERRGRDRDRGDRERGTRDRGGREQGGRERERGDRDRGEQRERRHGRADRDRGRAGGDGDDGRDRTRSRRRVRD